MLIQQLSAIIFPKKPRPVPIDQESDRDQTVPAMTTPVSSTPASADPEGSPVPHTPDLYDPQFPVTMERMHGLLQFLGSHSTELLTHAALEDEWTVLGRDLLRVAMEEHFQLRALTEVPLPEVVDARGMAHTTKEAHQTRPLVTRFGPIGVMRLAYRHKGTANLYPADAAANLPTEKYSHGLREIAAKAAVQGSFDAAALAIADQTDQHLGKRQVEPLVQRAAEDVSRFYPDQVRPTLADGQALILSVDGKGIVMRTEALRPSTAAKRANAPHKLQTRLSPGEKSGRRRMAKVGAVYPIDPVVRIPSDILQANPSDPTRTKKLGPKAMDKWLVASVADEMGDVIYQVLEEAQRRDPQHEHPWVALVDGHQSQWKYLRKEAQARGIDLKVFFDFIHGLEYLWKAAWCFFSAGDADAEKWVLTHGLKVLQGRSSQVAGAIGRKATVNQLNASQRKVFWLTPFVFGLAKSVIISSSLFPRMYRGWGTPPGVLTLFADWRRQWVFWVRQSANPSPLG